jgi:RIO kinase 1
MVLNFSMKAPKRLQPLLDDGLIDDVICRLMSGKEADIFIVRCGDERRCAKIYKEASKRNFKNATAYREGRKVRGGRQARAMKKRSTYGRQQQEEIWQNAEVDALSKLARAGIRVPETYGCVDGVLLMELVSDDEGEVAPRLGEVILPEDQALEDHEVMMHYIKLMLCAGIVHGDLSEFNVLLDSYGPVIIDLPQAVDAAANNNAREMFFRDTNNITRYYAQFAPQLKYTRYAEEMWSLYEEGELDPDTKLTGLYDETNVNADVAGVLEEIMAVKLEEEQRQARLREAEED